MAIFCLFASVINDWLMTPIPGLTIRNNLIFLVPQIFFLWITGKFSNFKP